VDDGAQCRISCAQTLSGLCICSLRSNRHHGLDPEGSKPGRPFRFVRNDGHPVTAPPQSRRSSLGCRDRSHPHWSYGCGPRKSHVRCIRADWCRGCGTACRCRQREGTGRAPLLILSRRPSRPFLLAANRGHAGPSLSSLAHGCAVANRLASRQHVVNEGSTDLDQDRARASLR